MGRGRRAGRLEGGREVGVGREREEKKPVSVNWDRFQARFAVDYSLVRWRWQLDSAALTEHIRLKAPIGSEAAG